MEANGDNNRDAFQLERLILFSDAVFAIAITLLVIEIKVPELHGIEITDTALLQALVVLIPKFMAFLVSFFLIAMYWWIHHRLLGYVVRQTPALLALNLLFLLTIVLMPFSTGLFGAYSRPSTLHLKLPLAVYVANVVMAGVANLLLWRYVGRRANGVSDDRLEGATLRDVLRRATVVPAIVPLVIPASFVDPILARLVPFLIPVALQLTRKM